MIRRRAMISSAVLDLPEHRAQVRLACERAGFAPRDMKKNRRAIAASLKMVSESDVYLGIFAYRYGYVPDGHDISITEMECNRAVELGKTARFFFIDQDHPFTGKDVEIGLGATKLQALKDRIGRQHDVVTFKSPTDLGDQVVKALTALNTLDEAEQPEPRTAKHPLKRARIFISYRRSDSRHFAGRLYDQLSAEVDDDCLYMDVETAKVGRNFVDEVKETVLKCDALLVVIGQDWLTCCEANGRRLIDDSRDLLRVEISTALANKVPLIPILVDDVKIPIDGDLPSDIGELIYIHALNIRHEHFRSDVAQLLQKLSKLLGGRDG